MTKRIDLHIHTTISDGVLTPKEVIDEAVKNGVAVISIADHDTIDAYTDEIFEYAKSKNIKLIPAVEISTKTKKSGIHVLGYNFDLEDIEFKENVFYEDILWTPKVLRKANVLVTVPGVKYHYRANPKSIVKSIQSEKKQRDFYYAKRELISFFEKEKIRLDEKKKCI